MVLVLFATAPLNAEQMVLREIFFVKTIMFIKIIQHTLAIIPEQPIQLAPAIR